MLCHEHDLDPLKLRGSYAGAMGMPQFMPSNYRHVAVSASHQVRIDLWQNWDDVFASVGNFLRNAGWHEHEPVLANLTPGPDQVLQVSPHLMADTLVGTLRRAGGQIDTAATDDTRVVLINAGDPDHPVWRAGFHNFVAITHYNISSLYAMAVYELAQAIRHRVPVEPTP